MFLGACICLCVPVCLPAFHRFMMVYHDLSIYPSIHHSFIQLSSYRSLHRSIYPSIKIVYFLVIHELGLSSDIMATFAWLAILRLPRAQLCPYHAKTLSNSLKGVKCINCTGSVSCMKILSRPREEMFRTLPDGIEVKKYCSGLAVWVRKTKQNLRAWLYHGCPSLQKCLWSPSNFKHIRGMQAMQAKKGLNSANEQPKWHLSSRVAPLSSSGHLLSSSPGIYLTLRHREFYGLTMIVVYSRLMRQNPVVRTRRKDFWLWMHGVASQKRYEYESTLLGSDIHGLFIGTLKNYSVCLTEQSKCLELSSTFAHSLLNCWNCCSFAPLVVCAYLFVGSFSPSELRLICCKLLLSVWSVSADLFRLAFYPPLSVFSVCTMCASHFNISHFMTSSPQDCSSIFKYCRFVHVLPLILFSLFLRHVRKETCVALEFTSEINEDQDDTRSTKWPSWPVTDIPKFLVMHFINHLQSFHFLMRLPMQVHWSTFKLYSNQVPCIDAKGSKNTLGSRWRTWGTCIRSLPQSLRLQFFFLCVASQLFSVPGLHTLKCKLLSVCRMACSLPVLLWLILQIAVVPSLSL